MSTRDVVISFAVNFCVAGSFWYLKGPNAGLISFGIGVALFVGALLFMKRQPELLPSQRSIQKVEANPQQNVYIGADLARREYETPEEKREPRPKPKTNLSLLEAKSVMAHADGNIIYESPAGLGDFHVSIVRFRNNPVLGQSIREPALKSQVVYKDKDGIEITDVPRGVWLGQYGESALFEAGKKQSLVVFLLTNQDTLKKLWNEGYTSTDSWMAGGPLFQIRDEVIHGDIASLEISLLSEERCLLRGIFKVEERKEGKLPQLVLVSVLMES